MNQNQLRQRYLQQVKHTEHLKGLELFEKHEPLRKVDDFTPKMVERVADYLNDKRQVLKVTKICDCGSKLTVEEASAKMDEMDKLIKGGEKGTLLNFRVFKEDDQWLMVRKDCGVCLGKGVLFSTPVVTFSGPMEVKVHGYKITGLPVIVLLDDVSKYAKQKCKSCSGRGISVVTRAVEIPGAKGHNNFRKFDSACMCARERFLKDNVNVMMDHGRGEWILIRDFKAEYDAEFAAQELEEEKRLAEAKAAQKAELEAKAKEVQATMDAEKAKAANDA